mmetsp:Transcript_18222/g.25918  ORF Transcript_18222/g.25918 Transcript_18222/m.25918 type:complete len:552 (+) Transcript_18222:63-1718(+)
MQGLILTVQRSMRGRCISSSSGSIHRLQTLSRSLSTEAEPQKQTQQRFHSDPAMQNKIRAEYSRAMKETRKRYAEEVAAIKAKEEAERQRANEELAKQKAERQKLKVLKSIESAKKQLHLKQQRQIEWEEELRLAQQNRDERKERFHKARLLILQELEEEAEHWVATTPQEVEQVFDHNAHITSQQLWARPHSRIGVAPEDATFWRYMSDTWDMSKTYRTPKDVIFQHLQEQMDYQANLDETTYWTPQKQQDQFQKEERARLRALVQRQSILQLVQQQLHREALLDDSTFASNNHKLIVAQVQYQQSSYDLHSNTQNIPPDHPLRDVLAKNQNYPTNFQDMERQVALSKDNFHKFFLLEDAQIQVKPHESWPVLLGKEEKPDMRIEKERKRDKKEDQTLWSQMGGYEGADQEEDDDADDEQNAYLTSQSEENDEEQEQDLQLLGIDPVIQEFYQGPEELKLNEQDIDWMIEKLEKQVALLEDDIKTQMSAMSTSLESLPLSVPTTPMASNGLKNENDINYITAMGIVNTLTKEQQDAICALENIGFKGDES